MRPPQGRDRQVWLGGSSQTITRFTNAFVSRPSIGDRHLICVAARANQTRLTSFTAPSPGETTRRPAHHRVGRRAHVIGMEFMHRRGSRLIFMFALGLSLRHWRFGRRSVMCRVTRVAPVYPQSWIPPPRVGCSECVVQRWDVNADRRRVRGRKRKAGAYADDVLPLRSRYVRPGVCID